MSERATRLHATADEQIAELIDLVARLDEVTLRLPCPGREKLGGHGIPRFLKALGHRPPEHDDHSHDATGPQDNQYQADHVEPHALREQLAATRETLARIATLTDGQLETIPLEGSFRFCDGQRTLARCWKASSSIRVTRSKPSRARLTATVPRAGRRSGPTR